MPGLGLGFVFIMSSSMALAADPSGRANAIAAADAASGIAAAAPTGPVCTAPPASGEKLAGDMKLAAEGHGMVFTNAGARDALVKIRHADTRKLAVSFFLRKAEEIEIDGVPDGTYKVQYAFGPALAVDCRSFTSILKANELPDADELKTTVIDDEDHTEVKRMSVAYQISVTETANVKPISIDAATFNAD